MLQLYLKPAVLIHVSFSRRFWSPFLL